MPPRQIVSPRCPNQYTSNFIMARVDHDQHVCAVNPLCTEAQQCRGDRRESTIQKPMVVGVEYHKRFDESQSHARRKYSAGAVRRVSGWGTPSYGRNVLISTTNFHNWCTHGKLRCYSLNNRLPLCDLCTSSRTLLPTVLASMNPERLIPTARKAFLPVDRLRECSGTERRLPERCNTRLSFPSTAPEPTPKV